MSNSDKNLLMISALQHILFYCAKRCTLVHVEQLWSENVFTVKGEIKHDKTSFPARRAWIETPKKSNFYFHLDIFPRTASACSSSFIPLTDIHTPSGRRLSITVSSSSRATDICMPLPAF